MKTAWQIVTFPWEVFTSPKLAGTNGVLEVTETFLAGFYYKDLRVVFRDGMVTEYHCSNFDSEEKKPRVSERDDHEPPREPSRSVSLRLAQTPRPTLCLRSMASAISCRC